MRVFKKITVCMLLCLFATSTYAESWPSKPIKLLVGFSAGGTTDIIARKLASGLSELFGQSVVVENKTGASGMIASAELARARPDGYTIGMVISSNVSVPAIGRAVPFDPIDSFEPLALVGKVPLVLTVNKELPVTTLSDFVNLANERPGEMFFSSPGIGLAHHFAGELLNLQAHINMTHVPYAGAAPALGDVMSNQVQATFAAAPTVIAMGESRAKPIAISGKHRVPLLPGIATISESGYPDYELTEWFGVLAPAHTPIAIVEQLNVGINKLLNTPEWREWLDQNAVERPAKNSSDDFRAFIKSESEKFVKIAKTAQIKDGN